MDTRLSLASSTPGTTISMIAVQACGLRSAARGVSIKSKKQPLV